MIKPFNTITVKPVSMVAAIFSALAIGVSAYALGRAHGEPKDTPPSLTPSACAVTGISLAPTQTITVKQDDAGFCDFEVT
jgi:hypothetical protein